MTERGWFSGGNVSGPLEPGLPVPSLMIQYPLLVCVQLFCALHVTLSPTPLAVPGVWKTRTMRAIVPAGT